MSSDDLLCYSIMHNGPFVHCHPRDSFNVNIASPFSKNQRGWTLPPLNLFHTKQHVPEGTRVYGSYVWDEQERFDRARGSFDSNYSNSVSSSSTCSSPKVALEILGDFSRKIVADARPKADNGNKEHKRRQRSGPSCDSCRARKIKCNAEISVMSKNVSEKELLHFVSGSDAKKLLENGHLPLGDNLGLFISNNKLIKLRGCFSCKNKGIDCHFSKGFTKDDFMMDNNRRIVMVTSLVHKPDYKGKDRRQKV